MSHNLMKSQLFGASFISCKLQQDMQQFEETQLSTLVAKYGLQTLYQTSERLLDTAFICLHRLQSSLMSLHTLLGKPAIHL